METVVIAVLTGAVGTAAIFLAGVVFGAGFRMGWDLAGESIHDRGR